MSLNLLVCFLNAGSCFAFFPLVFGCGFVEFLHVPRVPPPMFASLTAVCRIGPARSQDDKPDVEDYGFYIQLLWFIVRVGEEKAVFDVSHEGIYSSFCQFLLWSHFMGFLI